MELGILLASGTDGLFDGKPDGMLLGRILGMLLGTLEGWGFGALMVGAGDLLGGSESKLLGFCDG